MTADSCAASDCAGFVLVLLLVMVDLDITGRLLIIPKVGRVWV